jgi:integrase
MILKRQYLTPAEVKALFKVINSKRGDRAKRDRAIVSLLANRGLRAGEIELLKLSDLSGGDRLLSIHRKKQSLSQADCRLLPAEIRALRSWLKVRGKKPGPLFPSRQHRPRGLGINRSQVFRMLRAYAKEAGIDSPKATPRALRHSCGVSLSLESGGDLRSINERLGHSAPHSALQYVRRRER